MSLFDYPEGEAIGVVTGVDTGNVLVQISDEDKIRRLQVNHLIVIRSSRAGQHLIGIISKIMRKALVNVDTDESNPEVCEDSCVVENIVKISLIGTLLDRYGKNENVFRRTLESVPEIDALSFSLEGERLTAFMRAIGSSLPDGKPSLCIGNYTLDEDAEAWLDGNRFFQRHAVIVGGTGSGKSWTVAKLLEQVAELPMANSILFDIHGEYKTLTGKGIIHLRIAGPGDLGTGADLDKGVLFLPYWLLTYEEMLALLLDRSDQNAPNQAMLFSKTVADGKRDKIEEENKTDLLENFTVDSPIPYSLDKIIEKLNEMDNEMVDGAKKGTFKQGPFHGKLTRFVQRLEAKRNDRRLGFLFQGGQNTLKYEWMTDFCKLLMQGTSTKEGGGVKIIDFSEVPSDVLPLMVGLVARILFSVQQWTKTDQRHPIAIFCDEAHLYLPNRADADALSEMGLKSFERIAKEGRKYGVGMVVISQRPAEVNRTILSQCGNFVAMRLLNREDRSVIQGLLPDSLGGIAESLAILDIGEALIVGDASLLPSRIRIDPPTHKPTSATVEFWDRWSAEAVDDGIESAVESLRRQSRKSEVDNV